MALRRGFRGQSRVVSARRMTTWGFGPDAKPISVSASGSQLFSTGAVLTTESKATLVRVRGHLTAFLLSATAAGDGFAVGIGIGLVTNDAFAAGAGSIPDPIDDADDDMWLYHRFFFLQSPLAAIAPSAGDRVGAIEFEIDSKAMRKWTSDQTLVGMIQTVENGTATGEIWIDTRVLLKLA